MWNAGTVDEPWVGERPRAIDTGVGCVVASGALWLFLFLTDLPPGLWDDPAAGGYGHVGGLFAAFGVLMAALSMYTWGRSPQAWLLLQVLSVITLVAGLGGAWAIYSSWSTLSSADRWLMPLCVITGATQTVAVVLLNQRNARRWCQVEPLGHRMTFWK